MAQLGRLKYSYGKTSHRRASSSMTATMPRAGQGFAHQWRHLSVFGQRIITLPCVVLLPSLMRMRSTATTRTNSATRERTTMITLSKIPKRGSAVTIATADGESMVSPYKIVGGNADTQRQMKLNNTMQLIRGAGHDLRGYSTPGLTETARNLVGFKINGGFRYVWNHATRRFTAWSFAANNHARDIMERPATLREACRLVEQLEQ